jgi:hypothetical protein
MLCSCNSTANDLTILYSSELHGGHYQVPPNSSKILQVIYDSQFFVVFVKGSIYSEKIIS